MFYCRTISQFILLMMGIWMFPLFHDYEQMLPRISTCTFPSVTRAPLSLGSAPGSGIAGLLEKNMLLLLCQASPNCSHMGLRCPVVHSLVTTGLVRLHFCRSDRYKGACLWWRICVSLLITEAERTVMRFGGLLVSPPWSSILPNMLQSTIAWWDIALINPTLGPVGQTACLCLPTFLVLNEFPVQEAQSELGR